MVQLLGMIWFLNKESQSFSVYYPLPLIFLSLHSSAFQMSFKSTQLKYGTERLYLQLIQPRQTQELPQEPAMFLSPLL